MQCSLTNLPRMWVKVENAAWTGEDRGAWAVHCCCNAGFPLPTFRTLPWGAVETLVSCEEMVSDFGNLQGCHVEGREGDSMGLQKQETQ